MQVNDPDEPRIGPVTGRGACFKAFVVAAALLSACGREDPELEGSKSPPGSMPESNLRMAMRLRKIADDTDPTAYPYANDRRAELAHQAALQAPPGPQRFQLLLQSSIESIRSGAPEEALDLVEEASQLLRASGAPVTQDTRSFLLQLRALASLRLGEQENCLQQHTIESCILPIRERGVHTVERGSRGAIDALLKLLEVEPDSLKYRWLLNLAHMTLGEYPDGVPDGFLLRPSALASEFDLQRFEDIAGQVGVDVRDLSGGAIMEDFDGDGLIDLVASSWGLDDQLRFFRQRAAGDFEDRTKAAGLEGQLGGLNLSHADYDNDGDADMLVLRGAWLFDLGDHPNSLLRNDGSGTFVDVTEAAGLMAFVPSHTGAWGDYDNDGWLDLFVGNEPSQSKRHRSQLFHNRGDGTFVDVSRELGLDVSGIVKAASWGDYDNDGQLDLYVSRFGEENQLFRNAGGKFADVASRAGVGEPKNSFPAWFFDYDNDGWLDILVGSFGGFTGDSLTDFVSHYFGTPSAGTPCRVFRNHGDGTFENATREVGLERTVLAMGANFGDIDNDGWLDVYLGTGEPMMTTLVPNLMFRNDRGQRFQDVTSAGGFGNIQKGHGVAFGDIDADGDQDIYITMGGAFSGDVYPNILFENPGNDHRWITLRFHGVETNRGGLGARVKVVVTEAGGETREIHRVVGTGGSFGSSTQQLEIGLGDAAAVSSLEVLWPVSGRRVTYGDVPLDAVLIVREDRSTLERVPVIPVRLGVDPGATGHHHGATDAQGD